MKYLPLTARKPGIPALAISFLLCTAGHSQATPTVDLTVQGAKGAINGALFYQASAHPAGSSYGALNAFLKIQSTNAVEAGYNTDHRYYNTANGVPFTELDQITDHHTRALRLSEIPTITIDGITYREFLLDFNEPVAIAMQKYLLSLDALQIFMGDGPDLHDYMETFEPAKMVYNDPSYRWNDHATMIYNMDSGGDHWVGLDYRLNLGGSGWADAYVFIRDDLFNVPGRDYVYLYSKFGENWANDNNFEEWGVSADFVPEPIPEPATMLLFGTGLVGLAGVARRKAMSA